MFMVALFVTAELGDHLNVHIQHAASLSSGPCTVDIEGNEGLSGSRRGLEGASTERTLCDALL